MNLDFIVLCTSPRNKNEFPFYWRVSNAKLAISKLRQTVSPVNKNVSDVFEFKIHVCKFNAKCNHKFTVVYYSNHTLTMIFLIQIGGIHNCVFHEFT